jgi:hypothetical protein
VSFANGVEEAHAATAEAVFEGLWMEKCQQLIRKMKSFPYWNTTASHFSQINVSEEVTQNEFQDSQRFSAKLLRPKMP